ncbi:MAG: hypothetical protein AB1512_22340 [Thermodesulfobacteriota bacterium]
MEESRERGSAAEGSRSTGASIPFVEDGRATRMPLSALLTKMGFRDAQTKEGDEALD